MRENLSKLGFLKYGITFAVLLFVVLMAGGCAFLTCDQPSTYTSYATTCSYYCGEDPGCNYYTWYTSGYCVCSE